MLPTGRVDGSRVVSNVLVKEDEMGRKELQSVSKMVLYPSFLVSLTADLYLLDRLAAIYMCIEPGNLTHHSFASILSF